MTQDTPTTVINVTVKNRGDLLFASSEDIFGLNVVAPNEDELCKRIVAAVKWLFKQNRGMDVQVLIPSPAREFSSHPAANRSIEQLVIAPAAAA